MPFVLESLVLQQEDNRLVALICPDYNEVDASGLTREQLDELMEDSRKQVNSSSGPRKGCGCGANQRSSDKRLQRFLPSSLRMVN